MDTSGSALRAVATGVIAALRAYSNLTARVTGVYTEVPANQALPYVHVTNWTENVIPAGMAIRDITFHAVAVSKYEGDAEALDIVNDVVKALHHATVTVSGYTFLVSAFESVSGYQEVIEGTVYRHYPISFRVVVTQ